VKLAGRSIQKREAEKDESQMAQNTWSDALPSITKGSITNSRVSSFRDQ
jgi:hypothetical protein